MPTLGLMVNNEAWVDIVSTLSLESDRTYFIQNTSDSELLYSFSDTKPIDSDPFHVLWPAKEKGIFIVENGSIWVRANGPIERNITVVVSDDRTVLPQESNGAVPVNVQDQTSPAIEHYLYQILQAVTVLGDYSIAENTITFDTGHGFTAPVGFVNDYVVLMYIDETQPTKELKYRFYQARVVLVVGDVVTFAVPLGFDIINANIQSVNRVNVNMALAVGDITAPIKFFTTPVNGVSWDLTRTMIDMISDTEPDDALFGGGPQLPYGLYFGFESIATNFFEFLVNIQDNGDFRSTAYDVNYTTRSGPQSSYGVSTRKSFAGQDKYGVAIRLDGTTNDEFVSYAQDDLTAAAQNLDRLRIKVMGHLKTN